MAETDGTQTRLAVSYNAELRWRKLHASLTEASAWRCVPWASDSLLETVQVWASACGVGAVPAEMQVGMFAMDTALLRIWRGEMIAWPSLDAYPRYTADSPGVRHHVAWQPLAMAYAMLGRDLSVEELGRHFKLSRPLAPLPAGPDRVAPDLDMVGTWELEQCAFVWRDLVTVPICIKKGYLVYAADGNMVAIVGRPFGLGGDPMAVYAGRWEKRGDSVYHLALYDNDPQTAVQSEPLTVDSPFPDLLPGSCEALRYGFTRKRRAVFTHGGAGLELSLKLKNESLGLRLRWRRVDRIERLFLD